MNTLLLSKPAPNCISGVLDVLMRLDPYWRSIAKNARRVGSGGL